MAIRTQCVPSRNRGLALSLGVVGIVLSGSLVLNAAQVVPLSLEETVRQAEAIVLGTIVHRQSRWGDGTRRWMVTDYTLAVEETLYRSDQGDPIAKTVVLTYWGGTIGDETQAISDLRVPSVGERLIVMLRPEWARRMEFSPVVGLNQGLFSVVPDKTNAQRGAPLVVDDGGRQLAIAGDGTVVRSAAAAGASVSVSLPAFRTWLAANINAIKSSRQAAAARASGDPDRVMPVFEKMPIFGRESASGGGRAPAEQRAPSETAVPIAPHSNDPAPAQSALPEGTAVLQYVTLGPKPNLPIVVNNLPDSFTPWSPEDEYLMSRWNYYASNVFHVFVTPTGTFAWGDNVFDLDGWISSATLQNVYGSPWGANTIGVTFSRWIGATVVEADIALNPAFSFTLDDEWVYDGSSAQGFRQVMIHELGHMLGLDHNFNGMSLMNYMPSEFRAFGLPYMDDAAGIRALYPGNAVARTDLGVNLYYASGFQSITDATHPLSVTAGGLLTVNNYTVENVGTTTINVPTVQWYLTSARNFNSAYYFLDETTFSPALPVFTRYTPGTLQRTFVVPSSVASGY